MMRVMNSAALEDMPPIAVGRQLDPTPAPDKAAPDGVFEAILFPNRSLPNRGFIAVMAIVIGANMTFGLYFFSLGAWPVLGFCGLDVLAVWLAFKLSYRQGRLHERVRLSADALDVSRVLPSGHETRWRLQPFWTRVYIDNPEEHEATVRVVSKGRTLILGAFLSPPERADFAHALRNALELARTKGDEASSR
jgi:uncharacterized membrane protein